MKIRFLPNILPAALVLALVASLGVACGTYYDDKVPPDRLWVHYFNDWHGRLEPFKLRGEETTVGGAAHLYTLLEARRGAAVADNADSILLVAGDVLQGTPLSTVFRGEPDFELLRRMGVDAMSLGNHEFDFGQPNLAARIEQVDFPVLAANVRGEDGEVLTSASKVLELPRTRRRVGILGLVTDDVPITTHRRNVQGLTFDDPVEVARRVLPELRAQSDYVIVVSHCGLAVDRLLAALPGVDLVVGGHDQQLLEPELGNAPIVQAGEWGQHLGEARLERLYSGQVQLAGNDYIAVDESIPPDLETEAFVAHYRSLLGDELSEELAVTTVRLDGDRQDVRVKETNFGNLVADAVREATAVDVALVNGGAIRASIEVGTITLEDVVEALPFDNQLQRTEMTGRELLVVLQRSAALLTEGEDMGGFLQVSGIRLELRNGTVKAALVGDQGVQADARYTVATTDFLAAGGDGYTELTLMDWTDSGYRLTDIVVQKLQELGEIEIQVDGRLKRSPG